MAFLYGWKCLLVMDPGLTAALVDGLGAYAQATLRPASSRRAVALAAIVGDRRRPTSLGVRLARRHRPRAGARQDRRCSSASSSWGFASGAGDLAHFAPFVERRPERAAARAGARGRPGAGLLLVRRLVGGRASWRARCAIPGRTLPRALALGVGAVTLLYVAVSAVFLYLVPIERRRLGRDLRRPGGDRSLRPERRARLVGAGGRVRQLGSLFAFMTFAPRLYYAMAQRRRRAALRRPHPPAHRHARPARSRCRRRSASVLVLVGSFDTIVAYFVFVTVVFLALTVAGLYRLPRPAPGAYRVPGWPVTPLVFLADARRDARPARGRQPAPDGARGRGRPRGRSRSTICSSRRGRARAKSAPLEEA